MTTNAYERSACQIRGGASPGIDPVEGRRLLARLIAAHGPAPAETLRVLAHGVISRKVLPALLAHDWFAEVNGDHDVTDFARHEYLDVLARNGRVRR